MNHLTPAILREAANGLSDSAYPDKRGRLRGAEHMCSAVARIGAFGFTSLLIEHGVPLIGTLGIRSHKKYFETSQSVRFMFLHFLALWLEDEE